MKISREARKIARQLLQLSLVNGHIDEARVAEISSRIINEKPRSYVQILKEFARLVRLELAKRRAIIESSVPLDSATASRIENSLRTKFGADITTEFRVRSYLIGGLRIQFGSDVWDSSIRARLEALEKQL